MKEEFEESNLELLDLYTEIDNYIKYLNNSIIDLEEDGSNEGK